MKVNPVKAGPVKFRHVIWDLDGTLLDTYPATDGALAAALSSLGYQVTPEALRPLTRITLQHAIAQTAAQSGLSIDAVYTAYEREYAVLGQQFSPAMPGALEAMSVVRERGGLNLLATHRDREGAVWRLKAAGLDTLLDDLLCVSDGYPRKPDPALFVALLEKHRLNPAEVLAVGDRDLDIRAGQAAGCKAALLVTAGVPIETSADWVLAGLKELFGGEVCSG
ncbi:HAD-IA family hydrolase [Deinococcus radiomollis]|uniref:HAD family hydrolase n=1 Tax=Deinococcus radiomollis TaxID=468916 RepID=UPI003891C25F